MSDAWEDRKKALEEEYFRKKDREALDKIKADSGRAALGLCPKCGRQLESLSFQGVSLDHCPACQGVWLDVEDLRVLAGKEKSSWLERWLHK